MSHLLHTVEHQSQLMERFDAKLSNIRNILSRGLNLFRLKSFESDTLVYLNALYKDLNNALDNGVLPYSLVDTEKFLEYYVHFKAKLQKKDMLFSKTLKI